jgi:hypothetical protein
MDWKGTEPLPPTPKNSGPLWLILGAATVIVCGCLLFLANS